MIKRLWFGLLMVVAGTVGGLFISMMSLGIFVYPPLALMGVERGDMALQVALVTMVVMIMPMAWWTAYWEMREALAE